MNKESIFDNISPFQEIGNSLNKKNEPSVDTTSINTYWNTVLNNNDKAVTNDLNRNLLGLIEANTINQTNNVYVPLIGLIANDTGSYFQTLDTDFTFFDFEQKIRTGNVQFPRQPQSIVVTTYQAPKDSSIDVLFFAPSFDGGAPIIRYDYSLIPIENNIELTDFGINGEISNYNEAIIGFQNEIITPNDINFRYVFSFNTDFILTNKDYILRITAVNGKGSNNASTLSIKFKTGQASTLTQNAPGVTKPVKQKR